MSTQQTPFIQWELNPDGTRKVTQRLNEDIKITSGQCMLTYKPSRYWRVIMADETVGATTTVFTEIEMTDAIDSIEKFKVNYETGNIYFHEDWEGYTLTVTQYYSEGVILYWAGRIYYYDALDQIHTLEDAISTGNIILSDFVEAATYTAILNTDTVSEAFGKTQKFMTDIGDTVQDTVLSDYILPSTASDIVATDTVVEAFGKTQKQIDTSEINVATYLKNVSPIYGILWDKGATPTLTRTDASIGMVANIGIGTSVVRNDFDTATIYREITTVTDTLGNEFVRIPKFYIKKTDATSYKQWQISKYQHTGFYLPKCFWDYTNSVELDYIDVGKYPASKSASVLQSVSGAFPLVNTNIVNMRSYATANNTGGLLGYQQLDIHVIDVLRTLFFIEFATLNSQSIMTGFTGGKYVATDTATATESSANRIIVPNAIGATYAVGQTIGIGTSLGGGQIATNRVIQSITADTPSAGSTAIVFDGAAVTVTTGNILYNMAWKNGFSSGITASSGVITANTDKYPCSYRGIENPFGSVYQFVDGVNIVDGQAWICDNASQYASNVFASPYEKLSYVNGGTNGYVSAMGFDSTQPFAEFPTAVDGGATTYYSDYYYRDAGSRIALFGGAWHNGAYAGLSFWLLHSSSATTDISLGGRLLKKPL